jgi:hypothetical protein
VSLQDAAETLLIEPRPGDLLHVGVVGKDPVRAEALFRVLPGSRIHCEPVCLNREDAMQSMLFRLDPYVEELKSRHVSDGMRGRHNGGVTSMLGVEGGTEGK